MSMTLDDFSSKPFGEKGPRVYTGDGAPTDDAIFNKGDWYLRTDVAAAQATIYVATAASGTFKALDALDS